MAYEEIKSSGVTAETPQNILLGAGTIHKGLKHGYYAEVESGTVGALEVIADSGTIVGSQIKLATVIVDIPTAIVGDHVILKNEWNFAGSLIGATSGGNKLKIENEIMDVDLDGANVKVEGLAVKTGETATLETNIAELTPDVLKMLLLGEINTNSGITGYSEIRSKTKIEAGDYVTGLGYIGKTIDGTPIVVIFDKALCTSGLELDGKKKDAGVAKATFECYAPLTGDLEKLPYHIYYPTAYGA